MQLKKLETLSRKYSTSPFPAFIHYLQELSEKKQNVMTPEIVSKRLKIPFGDAVFLLGILERNKLVTRGYQVFASDTISALGEFDSEKKIPEKVYDRDRGIYLDREHFFVDLIYRVIHHD